LATTITTSRTYAKWKVNSGENIFRWTK
jgi:hypothetical protein